jgi:hypothetical protein
VEHFVHVSLSTRVWIVARQVDGGARVTAALELGAKLVPAPGAVVGAVHEHEVHPRRICAFGIGAEFGLVEAARVELASEAVSPEISTSVSRILVSLGGSS